MVERHRCVRWSVFIRLRRDRERQEQLARERLARRKRRGKPEEEEDEDEPDPEKGNTTVIARRSSVLATYKITFELKEA